jgi:drug/metabolite transporter (DMT)-like permease
MLAVLLALAAAAGYGGSDYVAGLAARRASVVRVTMLAEATSAALLLCVVPFISSQVPSLTSVLWGIAAGVSGAAGAMALYLGFRHADFSVASSVSAVGTAAFSVLAGVLLGEKPAALSLAGIALALPAIVAVSVPARQQATDTHPRHQPTDTTHPRQQPTDTTHPRQQGQGPVTKERGLEPPGGSRGVAPPGKQGLEPPGGSRGVAPPGRQRHAAGVALGLAAGAGFGLFFIGLNEAGSGSDLWPIVISQVAALVTVACLATATRDLGPPPAGARRLSLMTGVISAVGTTAFFLATHHGLLAVTAVITSLYPAVTIVLARVVSAERLTALRIIGLSLAAASVALIAAGGTG